MKKNSVSESGLLNPRIFFAFLLGVIGISLAMLSFASNTESGLTAAASSFGGPDPTVPGAPRYQNFYAPAGPPPNPTPKASSISGLIPRPAASW